MPAACTTQRRRLLRKLALLSISSNSSRSRSADTACLPQSASQPDVSLFQRLASKTSRPARSETQTQMQGLADERRAGQHLHGRW